MADLAERYNSRRINVLRTLMGDEKVLEMLRLRPVRILPMSPWLRDHENHIAVVMRAEAPGTKPPRIFSIPEHTPGRIEVVCSCREPKDYRIPPEHPAFVVTWGEFDLIEDVALPPAPGAVGR